MNSLLYYYNNVQKMAAYQQAKRMQRGVKLGYGENPSVSSSTKFTMPPVTIGLSDYSIEYFGNSIGSIGSGNAYMKTSVSIGESGGIQAWGYTDGSNGVNIIRFGNTSDGTPNQTYPNVKFDNGDPFHLVITRQGTEIKIYVNNELAITWNTREVLDMGDMDLIFANSSDVGFVRVWNYALSADEIATLYNNGDPMGYVVPKAMRSLMDLENFRNRPPLFSLSRTWDEDVSTNSEENNAFRVQWLENVPLYRPLKVTVTVSNYEAGIIYFDAAFSGYNTQSNPIRENGTFVFITTPNEFIYGRCWCKNEGSGCKCTVTVNSVEVVGLLAEYLPQNLIESRKGPAVEPVAETFEMNMGDVNYKRVIEIYYPPYSSVYRIDYIVDEWDCTPAPIDYVGFGFSFSAKVLGGAYKWRTLEAAKIGELQSFIFSAPSGDKPEVGLYAALNDEGAITRHLKVTIKEITPVSVPISWLDSAKQLPLSECMEPLFQSIGGYDMTGNGAPEILYNE